MSVSKLCSDIVAKMAVDHGNREIQDITSALEELLKKLVTSSSLMLCGSMAEKTALWKFAQRQGVQRQFIEYDYLVFRVVNNELQMKLRGCRGCRELHDGNIKLYNKDFFESFLADLYLTINTSCRVKRDTGYLHIATVPHLNQSNVKYSEDCQLVVYWTSNTGTLMAPNIDTLQLTEKIERLVIRVDILPALVISEEIQPGLKLYVIPKRCPRCRSNFMVSYCMYEWNAIHNNSRKHIQAYSVIKFLYGQFSYWAESVKFHKSYHAKVAIIKHCETCNDEKDCTECVTDILQSLVKVYTSESLKLPKFHVLGSLNVGNADWAQYGFKLYIVSMKSVVSELKSLANDKQCSLQCRLRHVVDLIKRRCLELLDGSQT